MQCAPMYEFLRLLRNIAQSAILFFAAAAVRVGTLPYYRFYQFNTTKPLETISVLFSQSPDSRKIPKAIALWRDRKLTELQYISISCAVLASAVIGAFSWTTIKEAHWLAHGLRHSSLVLPILGLLLSASEISVLRFFGSLPMPSKNSRVRRAIGRYEQLLLLKVKESNGTYVPRKIMIFTWQCPMMFMAYSVCSFLAGLTILICTPLIMRNGRWNGGCNEIAVMYLTVVALAGPIFISCSFWIYRSVDLDFDVDDERDGVDEEDNPISGRY